MNQGHIEESAGDAECDITSLIFGENGLKIKGDKVVRQNLNTGGFLLWKDMHLQ